MLAFQKLDLPEAVYGLVAVDDGRLPAWLSLRVSVAILAAAAKYLRFLPLSGRRKRSQSHPALLLLDHQLVT